MMERASAKGLKNLILVGGEYNLTHNSGTIEMRNRKRTTRVH